MRGGRGFTLLEVLVALVVGGMAVAGAAALLSVLADRAAAVERAAARVDRDANAERWLRAVFANLELSIDTATRSLAGDGRSLAFRSWCSTAGGWLAPCAVRLFLEERGGVTSLRLRLDDGQATIIALRDGLRTGGLRYLVDAKNRGTWTNTWSKIALPAAVAVIADGDTLILRVWGSG